MRRIFLCSIAFLALSPLHAKLPVALEQLRWRARPGFSESDRAGLVPSPDIRTVDSFPVSLFTLFPPEYDGKTKHYSLEANFALDPQDLEFEGPAAIFIRGLGDNWELYVNGTRIKSEMHLDASGEIALRQTSMGILVPFEKSLIKPGNNTIILHLAGHATPSAKVNPAVPGLFFSKDYTLDSLRALSHRYSERTDLALLAVYLFFGLYHLVIFGGRRQDRYNLYFGLFAITLAVYGFSRSYVVNEIVRDSSLVTRVENASIALLIPLFLFFLHDYFYGSSKRTIVYAIAAFNFAWSAAFLFAPFETIAYFAAAWKYAAIPTILIYAPWLIAESIIRKARDARVLAAAHILFILVCIFDLVRDVLHLFSMELLFQYAFFGFVVSIAGVLAVRFIKVFNETDRLNSELAEKNAALRELDRIKDEFIGTISHELRTPLNGIVGLAEGLAASASSQPDPDTKRTLYLIVESGRRLSRLVGDLIEFVRLKNRDLKIQAVPVRVCDAVDVVVSLIAPLITSKPITIETEIPPDLPAVIADPDRLQQILFNLVWNAVKFTERGKVIIRARAGGRRLTDPVTIEVQDTGIGIPEEKQDVIFEAFRQADSSIARPYSGAGLGLSITRYLVELHGGQIQVDSHPGQGSRFYFTLPATEAAAAQITSGRQVTALGAETPHTVEAVRKQAARILAVDDEPINLEVLRTQLSFEGYHVMTAENGETALDLIKSSPPDMVILDIMMPRISGYQVCEEIRKTYSVHEMPVLLLTARNQITDLLRGFDAGANDYLTKPFEARELSARVRTLLAVKRTSEEKQNMRALEKELAIARDIQRAVLPKSAPEVPGLKLATRFLPKETVGGDFYDFFAHEKSLEMIMADVSGHGVPAALIAAMIKIAFSHQHGVTDPSVLLHGLNRVLWGNLDRHFVTAIALNIDPAEGILHLASAGHPPLLLQRQGQPPQFYSARGRVIGLSDEVAYGRLDVPLNPGDLILVYTDGLTEARNETGDLYGEDRLAARLSEYGSRNVEQVAALLEEDVLNFAGGTLDDDLAFVVVQIDSKVY